MAEKSYFRLQLDSTIRETEKLLKMLHTIGESRDLENALQRSVNAAKVSEGVALKTRALPAHTGHPQAERGLVKTRVGCRSQGYLLSGATHFGAGILRRLGRYRHRFDR